MEAMIKAFGAAFKSKRLVYRPAEDADKEYIHSMFWSNPVQVGLAMPMHLKVLSRPAADQQTEGMIKNALLSVIILLPSEKEGDDPQRVGFLSLRGGMPCRSTSVSMSIGDEFQGRGYGRESLNWAIDWAFCYADIHRIDIATSAINERALGLYKSVGFVEEGRKRKVVYYNRQWVDAVEMGMLEEDYERVRGAQVQSQ